MAEVVFYLNREAAPRRAREADDISVLEYLRARGLTGTKEGCASGDCGACTVVAAEAGADGTPQFRAFNSCIAMMPAVHGKWLVTVEGLKQNGKAHAVQKAMVKAHASQCGFCTPGFVMSMFAFGKSRAGAGSLREQTTAAISGNLCRCTGYRPIVAAAMSVAKSGCGKDGYDDDAARKKLNELRRIAKQQTAAQISQDILRRPQTPILAGGTDLALKVTQQLQSIPQMISLCNTRELAQIKTLRGGWRIGAAANWESIARELGGALPSMAQMLERFGSPQIRYQATIGGNIANASPVADGPPPFIALGASVTLRRGGQTRQMPLEKFFRAYKKTALRKGEWIESVFVPKPSARDVFRVYKISKRREDDISSLLLALCLRRGGGGRIVAASIAAGGMAAIPKRAPRTERALIGKQWTAQTFANAARELKKDYKPISDMRASAQYRNRAAANLLMRFAEETTQ